MRSCAGIQNHFCCLHYLINKLNIKLQATKSNLMLRRSPWVDMIFIRRLWSYSVKVFNKLKVDWISSQYVDDSSDSVDYENIDDKNYTKIWTMHVRSYDAYSILLRGHSISM